MSAVERDVVPGQYINLGDGSRTETVRPASVGRCVKVVLDVLRIKTEGGGDAEVEGGNHEKLIDPLLEMEALIATQPCWVSSADHDRGKGGIQRSSPSTLSPGCVARYDSLYRTAAASAVRRHPRANAGMRMCFASSDWKRDGQLQPGFDRSH